MNKKKIFKCLLSASIVGTVFGVVPVETCAEWRQENNSWKYVENNKNSMGWNNYDSKWYYFNNDGIMQTGWVKDKNDWYYLSESGSMKTEWVNDKGTWYYLSGTGSMKTGWVKDNNNWYYLNSDGAMQTGVVSVADKVYYLNSDGAMQTGKVIIGEKTYEFANSGEAIGEKPPVEKDKIFGSLGNSDTGADINVSGDVQENESSNSNKNHGSNNSGNTSQQAKWNLIWEDNFNGDKLNEDNWNYEKREPGWVNSELQEYTDSEENVFVKDGNLVLKAIETERDGEKYYTSGKVTTQDKQTFKYGKFEIRAKAPKGQGLWPALWMMPNDESLYGQWPKCGEIDIMEILGHEPEKAYGTIHYGDPHAEQQGTYVLENGTFADDYHTYSVEWKPGEIRFFIDGNLYHTANDWFTKVEGGDEVTYPAPFDQPFYIQCNLAVGGSWPGNPNETTDFDNAELKVDYIKVYQLDKYDENVKKPEKDIVFRESDENGNYVINGDFSKNDEGWEFKTALNGVGTSEISDNKILIKTENAGEADYSIQLVQPGVPLREGGEYKVSFDAKAKENRSMIVDISGPDRSYIRYFSDTKVNLTSEKQNYSYTFTMKKEDDANARLEFNLGNQNSIEDVEISNIKIEQIGEIVKDDDDSKKIMPDGNYVNNGTFDVGEDRMKYWEVDSKVKNTQISVTNNNNSRELQVNVKGKPSSLDDVKIKQTKLSLREDKQYVLYFDAYADNDKLIQAQINGNTFDTALTKDKKTFKFEFTTENVSESRDLEFLLGVNGVTYIDNVRIEEDSLIRNGDFSSGLTGWQVFADGGLSDKPSYGVDSLKEKDAVQIAINNTGDADWKIQLKQNNVKLEEGQKYKLSFKAKSTVDRDIMYAIQRDGSSDNNWDAYTGSKVVELGSEYKTYEVGFEMKKTTDENAIFSISMGAVNGNQITDKHVITIDDVKLEKVDSIDDETNNDTDSIIPGNSIIKNGSFNNKLDGWINFKDGSIPGENYSSSAEKGEAEITIDSTGKEDWMIQLKQEKIKLEEDKKYKVSIDAKSTLDRNIMFTVQRDGTDGNWEPYTEVKIISVSNDYDTYTLEFDMTESTDKAVLTISMGAVNNTEISDIHTITIDNVIIVEVTEDNEINEDIVEDIEIGVENSLEESLSDDYEEILLDESSSDDYEETLLYESLSDNYEETYEHGTLLDNYDNIDL